MGSNGRVSEADTLIRHTAANSQDRVLRPATQPRAHAASTFIFFFKESSRMGAMGGGVLRVMAKCLLVLTICVQLADTWAVGGFVSVAPRGMSAFQGWHASPLHAPGLGIALRLPGSDGQRRVQAQAGPLCGFQMARAKSGDHAGDHAQGGEGRRAGFAGGPQQGDKRWGTFMSGGYAGRDTDARDRSVRRGPSSQRGDRFGRGGRGGEREYASYGAGGDFRDSGASRRLGGGYRGERDRVPQSHQIIAGRPLVSGESYRVVDLAPSRKPRGSRTAVQPANTGGGRAVGEAEGIRINKCFKDFTSRREADRMVEQGRVSVNGVVASLGTRVFPGDEVALDGQLVDWQYLAVIDPTVKAEEQFCYIKYWKPPGVVCTTDRRVRNNIIDAIGYPERIFPVGRLDKDSSGLILLTSDGRLPNAVLRSGARHDKRYLVTVDREIDARDVLTLAEGVVISTPVQRDRVDRIVTKRTLPCHVAKVDRCTLEIVLQEGRNRQIRRMLDTQGYTVTSLHRVGVMGLGLDGLRQGEWSACSQDEMAVIRKCLDVGLTSSS